MYASADTEAKLAGIQNNRDDQVTWIVLYISEIIKLGYVVQWHNSGKVCAGPAARTKMELLSNY